MRVEDHACMTGDCPHATQVECVREAIRGQLEAEAMLESLAGDKAPEPLEGVRPEDAALMLLRLQLYTGAQKFQGDDLRQFWDLLDEVRALKMIWIARLDEETCGECRLLHGKAVGLRERPPIHRSPDARGDCRCVVAYAKDER